MNTNRLLAALAILSVAGLGGCMDITGRGPAPLEKTVVEADVHPRAGHVYCMRGWLGIFSTGMDALADKIDKEVGAPSVSVADEEWQRLRGWIVEEKKKGGINDPLVLLGHSYGADDQIRVAQQLKEVGITVDLLVVLDPVTPPAVPTNVKRVYCVYKSHPSTDALPWWRGVPVTVEDPAVTPLVNIDLRTTDVGWDTSVITHINIEKSDPVHAMIMEEIKKTCPMRATVGVRRAVPVSQAPGAGKVATP